MLSDLYLKTKQEVSNIENIKFSKENWDWYYDSAVEKRIKDLKGAEGWVIKSFVHVSRAKALLKETQDKYLECL